ncbi:MAG: tetratricopeptide repeat protein [Woeseiaceae bacterium]|nr:tetratricopeptide repeat protein [Woeseiaceae bacterium]
MKEGRETVIKALDLARMGDIGGAGRLLQKMRNRPELEADACYGLGLIELCRNNLDDSEAYFSKATQLDPNHADAYYQLAKLADTRGDPVTAALYLKSALVRNPGHVMAAEALAEHDDVVVAQSEPEIRSVDRNAADPRSARLGDTMIWPGLNWKTVVSMIALAALAVSLAQSV